MIESRLEGLTEYAPEIYSYLMGHIGYSGMLIDSGYYCRGV
jgi:hypothetical protein